MEKVQVLVVEDEVIVSIDLRYKLESLGYHVPAEISSGEDAVVAVSNLRPDLVLMDIRLSGKIDGIDAGAQIREQSGVPVVYVTAHSDDATLDRAKSTEPFGYLLKPVDPRALQTVVEVAIYKHKIESWLKESERWLSAVLRSAGDAMVTTDRDGRVNLMNPAAESLLGLNKTQALGRTLAHLCSITGQPASRHPVWRALSENTVVPFAEDASIVIDDGSVIPVSGSTAPIRDDSGRVSGVVLTITDISERKKSERELADALDKAQDADRLKSQLLSTVSHELHTPLAAIKGFATTLLDKGDRLEQLEKREFLEEIDAASDRLNGMINHLLDYSTLEAGMLPVQPVPTDLNTIISGALVHFQIRAPQKLISSIVPSDFPEVRADPQRLLEVLDNVLDNALKYTPDRAQIWIDCQVITKDVSPWARICVRDNGPGIEDEQLTRIFEPFHQSYGTGDRNAGGVGLGLAISRRIMEDHDGRIWAESVEGHGTAFYITLPLAMPVKDPVLQELN